MKRIYLALMGSASLALLFACGGNNTPTSTPASPEAQQAPAPEPPAAPAEEVSAASGSLSLEVFSAQMKDFCGIPALTNDKMTKVVFRKESDTEFFMASPVTDDIDKEAVQREYFNTFASIADNNRIYGINMDGSRGTDTFKDYDEYVKFIKANGQYAKARYTYDFKGKQLEVYCSVSFGDFGLTVKQR
jgi:glucose/arabinose dehydrogenase